MSLEQNLEANEKDPIPDHVDEDEDAAEPQPLVVIQYRNRGIPPFLIPPALVLLAALVIMSYQRETPLPSPAARHRPAPAPIVAEKSVPTPGPQRVEGEKKEHAEQVVSAPVAARESATSSSARPTYEPVESSKDSNPAPGAALPKTIESFATKELVASTSPVAARSAPDAGSNEKLEPLELESKPAKKAVAVAPAPPPAPTEAPQPKPKPTAEPPSPFDLDPVDGLRRVEAAVPTAPVSEPPRPMPLPEAQPTVPNPSVSQPAESAPVVTETTKTVVDASGSREVATAARPEPAERPAIGFNLPKDADVPQSQSEPTREEIENDIQREADEKAAERKELEEIKPKAKLLEIQESVERAATQRVPFRNELRQILKTVPREKASPLIENLCDQYGRATLPDVLNLVRRHLRRASGRSSRQEAVEAMRKIGLPEPMILDYLARDLHQRTINSRNGPRTEEEIRVRAALLLLSFSAAPAKAASAPAPTP